MPNRKSHKSKKRAPNRESPTGSNGSSGSSEADGQDFKARTISPMPSREALVDHSEVSLIGDVQDPEHIDQG